MAKPIKNDAERLKTTTQDPELLGRWLSARREWDERYGDLITRAKNWRAMAFLMGGFSLLCLLGLLAQMHRSRVVPFVVAVDSMGRTVSSGVAEQASSADPRVIRADLIEWVEKARSITSDPYAERRYVTQVYDLVAVGSSAQNFLNEFYRTDSPFMRGQTQTVSVDVKSFAPISPTSYELDWTETTRDLNGVTAAKQEWKGVLTIALAPPKDEDTARRNPLGVYVTQINWSKVL